MSATPIAPIFHGVASARSWLSLLVLTIDRKTPHISLPMVVSPGQNKLLKQWLYRPNLDEAIAVIWCIILRCGVRSAVCTWNDINQTTITK